MTVKGGVCIGEGETGVLVTAKEEFVLVKAKRGVCIGDIKRGRLYW